VFCSEGDGTCLTDVCHETPQTCRPAQRPALIVKNRPGGANDTLVWKWNKGASSGGADYHDPSISAHYALCIYAGPSGARVAQVHIPPGANWASVANSWRYSDPTATADGVQKVTLKDGGEGRAKILLKGRGDGLPDLLDAGQLATPVIAQLLNYQTGACFGTRFETPRRNDGASFLAKE
jgi:hypothetical protein